ncbi:ABC transporter ATP-binding protein [Tabrizicola oligotrophica]|uniref:ABC transporter ATP-binding protein n=1 Tax=Tabrizicola oligotrophica TaxID=2710650 RepID=A0A6M0QWD3_9RHOB|nr:ABC transporter ATP-binding protein [Tabrizicola oligotrophica]NEY91735.1 ABC transporter ATP-binding protein [Tabrizicola oligotrophica]
MAAVEFQNVGISFGEVSVVRDLSLTVADGEFVVLVGPSGCGKSTILRSIAGLAAISAGDMRIGGTRMNDADPATRDIAMVFQSYALFPHMTVAQNLGFGLKIRGEAKATIAAKVAEAAATVGLSDHLHKRPGALSGGQRQRVALARAILRRPGVFLFDEPLSNLDAEFRTAMRAEIVRFHRSQGASMVYVTHDQTEAMTMGDRIAVLAPLAAGHKANLMQYGTPDEVYNRPANLFVARFIGTPRMNVVTLPVEGGAIRFGSQSIILPPAGACLAKVTLGQRPEHLQLAPERSDTGLTGSVEHIENLGHEMILTLATELGPLVLRQARSGKVPALGQSVRLTLDPDQVHLFDVSSEQRIE